MTAIGTRDRRARRLPRARPALTDSAVRCPSAEGATIAGNAPVTRIRADRPAAVSGDATAGVGPAWRRIRRSSTPPSLDLVRYQKLLERDGIARQQQADAQAALVKLPEGTRAGLTGRRSPPPSSASATRRAKAPITGRTGLRRRSMQHGIVPPSDTNGIVIITSATDHRRLWVPQEVLPSVLARLNAKTAEDRLKVQAIDRDGRTVLDTGGAARGGQPD